jgi:hypothetical protein
MPSKGTSVEATARRLRRALTRRYPGLRVHVDFNDHGDGDYKGWVVTFGSTDPSEMLGKVAPLQCHFGSSGGETEFTGVSWRTHGIIDGSQCYGVMYHVEVDPRTDERGGWRTKKMQAQVMRMLRPFIRGTWTPQTVRP